MSTLRTKVWSLIVTAPNGKEHVEAVRDREFTPMQYARDYISSDEPIAGLRVVEHEIDVPSETPPARAPRIRRQGGAEQEVWRQDRYRVEVVSSDGYRDAVSGPMSLEAAAKMACEFTAEGDCDVHILLPTDEVNGALSRTPSTPQAEELDDEEEDEPGAGKIVLALVRIPDGWQPTDWRDKPPMLSTLKVGSKASFEQLDEANEWRRQWNTIELEAHNGFWVVITEGDTSEQAEEPAEASTA